MTPSPLAAPALAESDVPPRWKAALANAIRDPEELCRVLGLTDTDADTLRTACSGFPLRVPRGFVARMAHNDPSDPLLRQVLPDAAELIETPEYSTDPLGESNATAVPGLLHKYGNRVLLTLTGSCAIHCRYCFRRHFPYADHRIDAKAWQRILAYIEEHTDLNEIILSGGDPLNAPDALLAPRVAELTRIPHISRLRIHTRQPVVLPERIDAPLLDWLGNTGVDTVMVIHSNHANELNNTVHNALAAIKATGTTLLNQSVLLDGINNTADALVSLSERLFACGVLPYYLHLPDRVQGTAHFHVSDDDAHALLAEARTRLPGYLVPRLAREVAGESSKRHL